MTGHSILETPSESLQKTQYNEMLSNKKGCTQFSMQLDIPIFTPLVNGEDLDTGKYEYFPCADKLIADPKTTLRIIRQLKNGEIPPNYKDYIFARYCVGLEDTNANAIKAAYEAFQSFKHFPLNKKKKILHDIYRLLSKNRNKLLDLMVIEGHPVKVAEWEISGMLKGLEKKTIAFYISQLNKKIKIDKEVIYLKRRPDGVICVSPPKNAPSSNSGIAILALLCGNTLIIKPPYRSPISTIFLWKEVVYKAIIENDAPHGTINIVLGNSETIMDEWVMSKYVNDVIYIGDSKRGLEIGAMAYHYGKKPILELSGSDFLFVWKDAPIDKVINSLLDGFLGSMQICMVPKKCVVHEDIFEEFKSKFIEEVKKLKVGLPSNPRTILSPVANIPLFYNFLEDALQKGAKLVYGGKRFNYDGHSNDNGVFISPTIIEIENIEDAIQMKCFSEENFFPLLPLIKATAKSTHEVLDISSAKKNSKDEIIFNKMISISNLNQYGLRCSVWVTLKKYKNRFIENIHNCGMLRVNSKHIDFSTYLSTHGGTGKTGGPFGEMNYIWQKTSHLQGISVF